MSCTINLKWNTWINHWGMKRRPLVVNHEKGPAEWMKWNLSSDQGCSRRKGGFWLIGSDYWSDNQSISSRPTGLASSSGSSHTSSLLTHPWRSSLKLSVSGVQGSGTLTENDGGHVWKCCFMIVGLPGGRQPSRLFSACLTQQLQRMKKLRDSKGKIHFWLLTNDKEQQEPLHSRLRTSTS